MGRIKKWLEWLGALVAGLAAIVGYGALQKREGAKQGAETEHLEADRQSVREDRQRTGAESAADLYKDLTTDKAWRKDGEGE